jgi:fructokinase
VSRLLGALETGGTTTRVAVAADASLPPRFVARASFATADPAATLGRAVEFFRGHTLAALGVAAFGPLELRAGARDHGALLDTPKAGWSRFPLKHSLEHALAVPVAIDTDVGAAALAEQRAALGEGRDCAALAYVTVGTGIGVGLALDGRIHHGALHPEAGHLRVARVAGDTRPGLCPFHGDCLEGLASGPAFAALTAAVGGRAALAIEADALAQLVLALVGLVAPHRIVLGGGLMQVAGLLDAVRARVVALSAGYAPSLRDRAAAEALLIAPRLQGDAGITGALVLAEEIRATPLPASRG